MREFAAMAQRRIELERLQLERENLRLVGLREQRVYESERQRSNLEVESLALLREKQNHDRDHEHQRIQLERESLALQREKQDHERRQAIWFRFGVILPLFIAAIGFISTIISQNNSAESAFKVKVAELVMSVPGPRQTYNKAKAIQALFPRELDPHFAESFRPELFVGDSTYDTTFAYVPVEQVTIDGLLNPFAPPTSPSAGYSPSPRPNRTRNRNGIPKPQSTEQIIDPKDLVVGLDRKIYRKVATRIKRGAGWNTEKFDTLVEVLNLPASLRDSLLNADSIKRAKPPVDSIKIE